MFVWGGGGEQHKLSRLFSQPELKLAMIHSTVSAHRSIYGLLTLDTLSVAPGGFPKTKANYILNRLINTLF